GRIRAVRGVCGRANGFVGHAGTASERPETPGPDQVVRPASSTDRDGPRPRRAGSPSATWTGCAREPQNRGNRQRPGTVSSEGTTDSAAEWEGHPDPRSAPEGKPPKNVRSSPR